jgi:predicted lipid-binding transport protein (Tim44 family)
MTTTDFLYYLLLGIVFGVYSTMQGLLAQRSKNNPDNHPADGLAVNLQAICRLERADDLDQLLQRLALRYEIVVAAFVSGAIADCAQPMSRALRAELSAASVTLREGGQLHPASVVRVCTARIVDASVTSTTARLDIAFTSLIEGLPASGGTPTPVASTPAADIWTFERPTDRHHPEWLLIATEPVQ